MDPVARSTDAVPTAFVQWLPPSKLCARYRPRLQNPEGSAHVPERFCSDQPHTTTSGEGWVGFAGSAGPTAILPITKMLQPGMGNQLHAAGSSPPCTRIL